MATKYNPNAQYVALKPVAHPKGHFQPGEVLDMSHRTSEQIQFLVEVRKVIAVAPAPAEPEAKNAKGGK